MRYIKSYLSMLFILFSAHLMSQGILEKTNGQSLTQMQLNLVKDFAKENINTSSVYQFSPAIFKENGIELSYKGVDYNFVGAKTNIRSAEEFYWVGEDMNNAATIHLYFYKGACMGRATIDGAPYDIQDLGNGQVVLYSIPFFEGEGDDQVDVSKEFSEESVAETRSSAGPAECKVRVLVAFSNQVDIEGRDFIAVAKARINDMNLQFANSGINHEVVLAGVSPINFDEPTSITANCSSLQCQALYDSRVLPEVTTLRQLHDADLVVTVISFGTGTAFRRDIDETNDGFSVISWNNFNSSTLKTFSHELGHNYGCRHNIEVDPEVDYTHGYNAFLDGAANWNTIMSYYNGCGCSRIDHYSNPNISYNGVPTGPDSNIHDCARTINERASALSGFEDSPTHKQLQADVLGVNDYAYVYGNQDITTYNNYIIGPGADVVFEAPGLICMDVGFEVQLGAAFEVRSGSCGPPITLTDSNEEMVETRNVIIGKQEELVGLSIYPNPMTTESVIEFQNPMTQKVNLFITNMEGKLMHSYHNNERLAEGKYSYKLDGLSSANGVYLCTMIIGQEVIQKRFVVSK